MRTDAIRLTQKQQALLRRRAVQLREKGKTNAEVAHILNVHRKTVAGWWAAYGRIGHALFEPGKRGRRVGAQRRLTAVHERDVRRLVNGSMPDQLLLPFALWNRVAVGQLIERRHEISLPARTLGEYLRRWGYSPRRPQERAGERTDRAMRTWLAETYPNILRGARRKGAQLFWGDQSGVYGEPTVPPGHTSPDHIIVVRQTATMTIMRAVTNRGAARFLVYKEALSVALLVLFCGRLIASTEGRAVCLVIDHLPEHDTAAFRRWTNDHRDEFTIHYLPTVRS